MADDKLKKLRDTLLNGKNPKERLDAAKKLQELGAGRASRKDNISQHSEEHVRLIAQEIKKLLAAD